MNIYARCLSCFSIDILTSIRKTGVEEVEEEEKKTVSYIAHHFCPSRK